MTANSSNSLRPKSINEQKLSSDHEYRWNHAREVIGFTNEDWNQLRSTEPYLRGELRSIVETLYEEFMKYEPTAQFYLDEDGSFDEEAYEHRVDGFVLWFERIFEWPEDEKYIKYMKDVGEIHTEKLGFEEMVVNPFYTGPTFSILFEQVAELLSSEIDEPETLSRYLISWQKFFRMQETFFRNVAQEH